MNILPTLTPEISCKIIYSHNSEDQQFLLVQETKEFLFNLTENALNELVYKHDK